MITKSLESARLVWLPAWLDDLLGVRGDERLCFICETEGKIVDVVTNGKSMYNVAMQNPVHRRHTPCEVDGGQCRHRVGDKHGTARVCFEVVGRNIKPGG